MRANIEGRYICDTADDLDSLGPWSSVVLAMGEVVQLLPLSGQDRGAGTVPDGPYRWFRPRDMRPYTSDDLVAELPGKVVGPS